MDKCIHPHLEERVLGTEEVGVCMGSVHVRLKNEPRSKFCPMFSCPLLLHSVVVEVELAGPVDCTDTAVVPALPFLPHQLFSLCRKTSDFHLFPKRLVFIAQARIALALIDGRWFTLLLWFFSDPLLQRESCFVVVEHIFKQPLEDDDDYANQSGCSGKGLRCSVGNSCAPTAPLLTPTHHIRPLCACSPP